ncbi:MAG: hypothetical protein U1E59_15885 [Amaricoccus sp.]
MVWDIGRAMRKKEEFESARLLDFAFRLRARTAGRFAVELGSDRADLVARTVRQDQTALLAAVAEDTGRDRAELERLWLRLEAQARIELIAEIGDPTPNRLA